MPQCLTTSKSQAELEELERLVAESDTGGREPAGLTAKLLLGVAIAWSLFQLWYASPLPFIFGVGILNDTEARAIHLGFALFLAYTFYPALRSSPRQRIPYLDWALGAGGRVRGLVPVPVLSRAGSPPRPADNVRSRTAGAGILLLLEATRRSLGFPMVVVATPVHHLHFRRAVHARGAPA